MLSVDTIMRYGMPGTEISGSKYYRGYCAVCREPIRVMNKGKAVVGACSCDSCVNTSKVTSKHLRVGNDRPPRPSSEQQYDGVG